MQNSEKALMELLEQNPLELSHFSSRELANLYVNSALLVTAMEFIKEQLWLKNKEDKQSGTQTSYSEFLKPFFGNELTSLSFLKDFLLKSGSDKIKSVSKEASKIESQTLETAKNSSHISLKDFAHQSLTEMSGHYQKEENDGHMGMRLYRTFDSLDEVFNLDYQQDLNMEVDPQTKERLYQKSGVGVQSGYSNILLMLRLCQPSENSVVIDLGSGYGRVGIVCSLLRPDIEFIGYEYVSHRVDISNEASKDLGLEKSLKFYAQDLSVISFQIPEADIYYLYDPFTDETYQHVVNQIVEVSKNKKVTIVTKGNARTWLEEVTDKCSWQKPELIDQGNLCIFRSL